MDPGNRLRVYLKTEETQENLCRDDRSQDLPEAYWLLASSWQAKYIVAPWSVPNMFAVVFIDTL
jgi:hypothetical protein